jgi:hypothetical protein
MRVACEMTLGTGMESGLANDARTRRLGKAASPKASSGARGNRPALPRGPHEGRNQLPTIRD